MLSRHISNLRNLLFIAKGSSPRSQFCAPGTDFFSIATSFTRDSKALRLYKTAVGSNTKTTAERNAVAEMTTQTTVTETVTTSVPIPKGLKLKTPLSLVEVFRKDYRPPEFDIESVYLDFDLDDSLTRIKSKLLMRRRPKTAAGDLVLSGDSLNCEFVAVDGRELSNAPLTGYSLDEEGDMTVPSKFLPPDDSRTFTVETHVTLSPVDNTNLVGLYKSRGVLCTQCEPHGFRRITYYLDRPDVMSRFTVRLAANKSQYPVLLSNGNKVKTGEEGEKHFAEFVDPFPKPCYLFALVAGDLASISSTFTTMSGRKVLVQLSSEPNDVGKLQWALDSVLKAMKWDEEKYGREYDLDEFHVFAVRDFNFGAMENKGLNIFNTSLLLADPRTTTDSEFVTIMSVVGHEYFHNWTGNRVTCRDWFQLTLKEGLTVYRENQFCGDMSSKLVNRIKDVQYLMSVQFPEDAGPMAHPIRPESYISMDNFYTPTVYDKGSFVIGMYESLLGADGFRKGMDLYFERHDLSAVTCDDFRAAMADANGRDLTQFERWYLQSGTPVVEVLRAQRKGDKYVLELKQSTPPTPKQPKKLPFHIPLRLGLVGRKTGGDLLGNVLVELTEEKQKFELGPVHEDCVLSINRGFSAPVKVVYEQPEEDLLFLMLYDTDGLNRWNAAQALATKVILEFAHQLTKYKSKHEKDLVWPSVLVEQGLKKLEVPKKYLEAFSKLLDTDLENSEKALCMSMPDVEILAAKMKPYDPGVMYPSLKFLKRELGRVFKQKMRAMYDGLRLREGAADDLSREDIARRLLRNTLFSYLVSARDMEAVDLAMKHYAEARVMNDKYAAFVQLMHMDFQDRQKVVDDFYAYADGDQGVLDKWFRGQAFSELPDNVERVHRLMQHPDFIWKNPNRFNSLFSAFAQTENLHREDGSGYRLLTDAIMKVDILNGHVAAKCCTKLIKFRMFEPLRAALMRAQLERISKMELITKDLYEIVMKTLDCKV